MSYLQHFGKNLRRSARAEFPCIGSVEGVESVTAHYLNTLSTIFSGIGGGMLFVAWELFGEKAFTDNCHSLDNSNRTVSYRTNPIKAIAYDAKKAVTHDFPLIGRSLFYGAPKYLIGTGVKGSWNEKKAMLKDIRDSFFTGLTAEIFAYGPASGIVKLLIPVGKDLNRSDWEYWLLWPTALVAGWTVGTAGIALKLGLDDYIKERKMTSSMR